MLSPRMGSEKLTNIPLVIESVHGGRRQRVRHEKLRRRRESVEVISNWKLKYHPNDLGQVGGGCLG
jgi:hypothetical protein